MVSQKSEREGQEKVYTTVKDAKFYWYILQKSLKSLET